MGEIVVSEKTTIDTPSTGKRTLAPKSDGWYEKDDAGVEKKLKFDESTVGLDNNVYVSTNGVDISGDGSLSAPFRTIGAAIDHLNDNHTPSASNNFCIMVAAGEYTEDSLALPRFVSLWGTHYRTRIIASSANIDLITSQGAHTIRDVLLTGVTGAGNYLIKASYTADTRLLIQNVAMNAYESGGSVSNGVYLTSTAGLLLTEFEAVDFGDVTGKCIELNSNARLVGRGIQVFDCSSATLIDSNGNCSYSLYNVDADSLNIGIDHSSTGASEAMNCNLRNAAIPLIKTVACDILIQNTAIVSANAQITNFEGISGQFFDEVEGEDTIRTINEFAVGLPEFGGFETCLGEGDSFTLGNMVYTYDGSTFTNVSTEASSSEGSTFTYPSSGSVRAMYISTPRKVISTSDYLTFQGIKISQVTAASSDGEFVVEYWDGSSWVEINHMSTEATGNYYPYAKVLFERTGDEQIRFTKEIVADWEKSDPVSLGISTYWIRFRAETVPTILPVFEKIKIHSNRFEVNGDGFIEYFAEARPVLSFSLEGFQAANNSPSNQDLYFQDNFGVGYVENLFADGATDQASKIVYLPSSVCTACPLRLKVILVCTGTSTAQSDWTIRWIVNKEGDEIYPSTSDAPTSNSNVQEVNVSVSPTGEHEQFTLEADLDISDYIADNADGIPDVLGIQIQRNGNSDSNSSNIALAAVNVFYVKINEGSHI